MKNNLKTEALLNCFSQKIFNKNYRELEFPANLFIYKHIQNYFNWRKIIAETFLPIANRKYFKGYEYDILTTWYFQKIPPNVITNAIIKAKKWVNSNNKIFSSIRLIEKTFLPVELNDFINHQNWINLGAGAHDYTNNGNDPWMYEIWKDYEGDFDFFKGPRGKNAK